MKQLRTVVFWLHLFSGVTAGAVILIMSATGVILALKPQIQNWIERDVRSVAPQPARLGAQRLLTAVKEARPDVVAAVADRGARSRDCRDRRSGA